MGGSRAVEQQGGSHYLQAMRAMQAGFHGSIEGYAAILRACPIHHSVECPSHSEGLDAMSRLGLRLAQLMLHILYPGGQSQSGSTKRSACQAGDTIALPYYLASM